MSKTKKADAAEEKKAASPESEKPEVSATTGWVSKAIDQAKSEAEVKAQKQAAGAKAEQQKRNQAGVPGSSQPSPVLKELSAREKLLAITEPVENVAALKRTLEDAKDLAASQEVVDRFVVHVEGADALAEYKLSVQDVQIDTTWDSLTWREREELLRNWAAEGDTHAEALIAELDVFLTFNSCNKVFLYDLVEKFIIPLTRIVNIPGLQRFLNELRESGWVNCWRNPHWEEADGVEISWGPKERYVYIPMKTKERKEKPLIARSWPYIKKRLAKVKEVQDGFDELRRNATPGFMPTMISHGEE
jgi:hypothetical protein